MNAPHRAASGECRQHPGFRTAVRRSNVSLAADIEGRSPACSHRGLRGCLRPLCRRARAWGRLICGTSCTRFAGYRPRFCFSAISDKILEPRIEHHTISVRWSARFRITYVRSRTLNWTSNTYRSQFSTWRPTIRANSRPLSVTTLQSVARACAAISMSLPPMGAPAASSSARRRA
jgi:hypothetical protein